MYHTQLVTLYTLSLFVPTVAMLVTDLPVETFDENAGNFYNLSATCTTFKEVSSAPKYCIKFIEECTHDHWVQ